MVRLANPPITMAVTGRVNVPEIINDFAEQGKLLPVVGSEPPQRKPVQISSSGKKDNQKPPQTEKPE